VSNELGIDRLKEEDEMLQTSCRKPLCSGAEHNSKVHQEDTAGRKELPDLTSSDEEIDAFLPKELKRKRQK
jgi:hypothetical protein